ncbi:MAG: hypothetical protein V7K50_01850 [Nostoc sp.]|uniref:hypothetical protein n=1 Tax=Nostoc sp. TaxID=1180 RepID=UPI002FF4F93A
MGVAGAAMTDAWRRFRCLCAKQAQPEWLWQMIAEAVEREQPAQSFQRKGGEILAASISSLVISYAVQCQN